MEVTTNISIKDSYRESARRTNLTYHPNTERINCGFHRGS